MAVVRPVVIDMLDVEVDGDSCPVEDAGPVPLDVEATDCHQTRHDDAVLVLTSVGGSGEPDVATSSERPGTVTPCAESVGRAEISDGRAWHVT